jgi:hypothetical protein
MEQLTPLQSAVLSLAKQYCERQAIVRDALRELRPHLLMPLENRGTPKQWAAALSIQHPLGNWGENGEWAYFLHGIGCRLTHNQTGEKIEWDAGDLNTFDLNWFLHWLQWRLKQTGDSEMIETVRSVLSNVDIPEEPYRDEISKRHRVWIDQFRLIFEPLCEKGLLTTDEWHIHYTVIAHEG